MGDNKRPAATPAAAKSKAAKTDLQEQNAAQTYFRRLAQGQVAKASDAMVCDAKAGLEVYNTLNREEKTIFAKKLQDTKASKNFGWVKDFKQSLSRDRVDKNKVIAKYMTRKSRMFQSWEWNENHQWKSEESVTSVSEA